MLGRADVGDDRRMAVSRYVMVGSDKINLIRFSPGQQGPLTPPSGRARVDWPWHQLGTA